MERHELARKVRRRRAVEAIEDEREREQLLREQYGEIVAEADGPEIDGAAFASMDPADADLVREVLGDIPGADDEFDDVDLDLDPEDANWHEGEIRRLSEEIALCGRRIRALERYVAAIDAPAPERAESV